MKSHRFGGRERPPYNARRTHCGSVLAFLIFPPHLKDVNFFISKFSSIRNVCKPLIHFQQFFSERSNCSCSKPDYHISVFKRREKFFCNIFHITADINTWNICIFRQFCRKSSSAYTVDRIFRSCINICYNNFINTVKGLQKVIPEIFQTSKSMRLKYRDYAFIFKTFRT